MNSIYKLLARQEPELLRALEQLDDEHTSSETVTLTFIGLVKAGKSTLANVLTDNLEQEYFKTARTRETRELKSLRVDQVTYTDTPGLDAEEADDQVAFDGILISDLLVLCHSLTQGELDQPTLDYLSQIKQHSQRPLADRLVCVLTKAEQPEEPQQETEAHISAQLTRVCGSTIDTLRVSANAYRLGRQEHEPQLTTYSRIPELKQYLQERVEAACAEMVRNRAERRQTLANALADRLQEVIDQEQEVFSQQYQTLGNRVEEFGQSLNQAKLALQKVL